MIRWLFVFFAMMLMIGIGAVADETIIVSSKEELETAYKYINENGGTYIVGLQSDISGAYFELNNSDTEVTIVGNGHTLTPSSDSRVVTVENGVLNLGDKKSALTLSGVAGNDNPGIIYVHGSDAACYMHDRVTIKDNQSNNYLGAGVSVQGGTFCMDGGIIQNCGIKGGSVCFGGGVAVYSGGNFIMDGGTIEHCYVDTDYEDIYDPDYCISGAGGGVFVGYGSSFEMNGGRITSCEANYGAGIAMVISYREIQARNSYGYTNNKVTITDGEITDNNAGNGGGIFASGYYYVDINGLAAPDPSIGPNYQTGLYIEGGTISGNDAYGGGGLYLTGIRNTGSQHVWISNAEIVENTAVYGAGIQIYYYWTNAVFENCTITDNSTAVYYGTGGMGGGIAAIGGNAATFSENTILCNNEAEMAGADIYTSGGASVNLPSAPEMKQKFYTTCYTIDGWYSDDSSNRWSMDKATGTIEGTNEYLGSTTTVSGTKGVIAAFTAHDEIEVTKVWNDDDDVAGQRPTSITVTLTDSSGQAVLLQTLDDSQGAEATIILSDANNWKGIIGPLNVLKDEDLSEYKLSENDPGKYYILKNGEPEINFTHDTWMDSDDTVHTEPSGTYKAVFTNIGGSVVELSQIWDDLDDIDGLRPTSMDVSLTDGTSILTDIYGQPTTVTLSKEDNNWQSKFILPPADYGTLNVEEEIPGGYYRSIWSPYMDGHSIEAVVVDKHIHKAADAELTNESMVEINVTATKVWNDDDDMTKDVVHPQIQVILYADDIIYETKDIVPPLEEVTFTNLPKYQDNQTNSAITYRIEESIADGNWIKVKKDGETYWYNVNGLGAYKVTVDENTITNTYEMNQTKMKVTVTKYWKDHRNENEVRPQSITIGLFKNETDEAPAYEIELENPNKDDPDDKNDADSWTKTIEVDIYDDDGNVIDYSTYTVKEKNGTAWMESDSSMTIGNYVYDFKVVTDPWEGYDTTDAGE